MVQVLESDWDERVNLDKEQSDVNEHKMAKGSLLVAYLDDLRRERKNVLKEVIRALMAFTDDDASDKAIYREVFDRELATSCRKPKRKRSPAAVDLQNDKFGDYFDDMVGGDLESEDDDLPPPASPTPGGKPKRGRGKPQLEAPKVTRACEGLAETIPLRLRLFRILSAAADSLPDYFCRVSDLFERFTDRVRSLPLPLFRLFVESHPNLLMDEVQVSLLRRMAEDLLPHNVPLPESVDPETDARNGISPLLLERCFLPFAAGKVIPEENAKLSLVLESMLWFMYWKEALLDCEGGMMGRAIERGIKAREDKIKKRGYKDGVGVMAADREAREVLERSARSLRVLIQVARL